MPRGNPKNLIKNTDLTPEELSSRNRKAGRASGKARHEKKIMSQIYADFLQKEHQVIGKDGLKKKLSGTQLLNSVMSKVLSRGDSSAVSLMREMREATEGNKISVDIPAVTINIMGVKPGASGSD
jgi:hypothetical protein